MTARKICHFWCDCQAFKMDKNRIRFKMLPLAFVVLGFLALGSMTISVEAKPNVELRPVVVNLRYADASFARCQDSQCSELLEKSLNRVKREGEEEVTTAAPAADGVTTPAAEGSSQAPDAMPLPGDVPLPPPTQMFPNLPPNFPYPSIEVVQSPPVPTRPRKRPIVKSPYPGAPSVVNPVATPPAIVKTPEISSAGPDFFDVSSTMSSGSDYETYGGQVDPGFARTVAPKEDSMRATEAPMAVPAANPCPDPSTSGQIVSPPAKQQLPTGSKVSNEQAATGAAAAYAFAPEDWRFSVTPKAHRRCKPTSRKAACRSRPPPQEETSDYDYPAAAPVQKSPACRNQQHQMPPQQGQRTDYDYPAQPAPAVNPSRGEVADPSMGSGMMQPGYRQPDPSMVNNQQPMQPMQPAPAPAARHPDPWTIAVDRAEVEQRAIEEASGGVAPATRQEPAATEKPAGGKGGAGGLTASVFLLVANVFYLLM